MKVRYVLIGVVASALVAAIVASCGGGSSYGGGTNTPAAATANVVRSAALDGAQAGLPTVTATGRGAVVVNPTTMAITGGINFTGLTGNPTGGAHIHDQAANDNIIIGLVISPDNATATVPAGTTLSPAQYADLLAGQLYFQVHTTANPAGEIRGQITGTAGLVSGVANLTGAQEVPQVTTTATGVGTVVVDSNTREVLTGYITHDVTNTDMAHIHCGTGPGTNGPVVVGFNLGTNIATAPAGAIMTTGDFSSLSINYCYFNVHSTANGNPLGEIRGDIAVQMQ